jgi:hypothetical protein
MTDDDVRANLAAHIAARRTDIAAFLRRNRPRLRRRAKVAVVLSALAAVFTAGPAAGGEKFSTGVQNALGLTTDTYVWRTLCLLALLVSIGAAVMAGLPRSDDTARIAAAETADAELEGLLALLQFGTLSTDDAAKLYQQYTVKVPFVETSAPRPGPAHALLGRAATGLADAGSGPETRMAALPPVPYPAARVQDPRRR